MRILPAMLLVPVLLAGCDPLFRATFETDPLGAPPLPNPPGPPPGDQIDLQFGAGATIEITPDVLQGSRALRIEAGANSTARAILRADGTGAVERPIVVLLSGRLTPGSRGEINVSTGGSLFAVQITLEDGGISANGARIGSYVEGGEHRLVLTLLPDTDEFLINFGGQVIFGNAVRGPLASPADFPGSSYAVLVEAASGGSVYIVDNITIGSRNF